MKKAATLILCAAMLCSLLLLSGCGDRGETLTLNVYNWGEYISDGSEGCFDTVAEFEKWYEKTYGQRVRVNYDTFASCEDMYAKLAAGAVSYDVIFPSDYMIARLREENMLLPLDFNNIPNYENISEDFKGLYYDPEDVYTVPYAYGTVGIIYNANAVDEADIGTWDLMWNEKYAGSILQFNNPRDAFGTAFFKLGLDVNSTDRADWDRAAAELTAQKSLRYGLVMDEIYNLMESGEAAVAAYYAGDYFIMLEAQADSVDLQFYYPEPTNAYVDAMCIPACTRNKELAEIFINYMLEEEPAIANAEFIYYAVPNKAVYESGKYREEMGEEVISVLYPENDSFAETYNAYAFRNLDQATLDYVNTLWETIKIN